jgi:hypothetical protein
LGFAVALLDLAQHGDGVVLAVACVCLAQRVLAALALVNAGLGGKGVEHGAEFVVPDREDADVDLRGHSWVRCEPALLI